MVVPKRCRGERNESLASRRMPHAICSRGMHSRHAPALVRKGRSLCQSRHATTGIIFSMLTVPGAAALQARRVVEHIFCLPIPPRALGPQEERRVRWSASLRLHSGRWVATDIGVTCEREKTFVTARKHSSRHVRWRKQACTDGTDAGSPSVIP